MKIELIKHKNIDFNKYDACLDKANAPIYPYSWYLDVVTKKDWNVLVLGDYETVMPLPYGRSRKTLLRRRIMQPWFCQQLGVFSESELDKNRFDLFYNELIRLNPEFYHFNYGNSVFLNENRSLVFRNNYALKIGNDYDLVFNEYTRSKKLRVKKSWKNGLMIENENDIENFVIFHNKQIPITISDNKNGIIKQLLSVLIERKIAKIINVLNSKREIVASSVVVFFKDRIYYLYSCSNNEGRRLLAINFLIDSIIKDNVGKEQTFDFVGSNLLGVEKFISAFGSVNQQYMLYKKN